MEGIVVLGLVGVTGWIVSELMGLVARPGIPAVVDIVTEPGPKSW
jgi:hypothetical protein